ncbi:MAG: hypothetical protein AB1540_04315 [Bdellovibrionota bacterium]
MIFTLTGAIGIIIWGIAHIAITSKALGWFGRLSETNRKIVVMEWVMDGLALVFIGLLVLLVEFQASDLATAALVQRACATMLIVTAVWTRIMGGTTRILSIVVCPLVKTTAAALIWFGSNAS